MRLQRQLHQLGRIAARVVAVLGVSATVVLAAAAVRLSRSAIVLPVLPPTPLVGYLDHPGFFNGAVRPVYRHSIVPGGVYSAEEVEAAMLRDQVVAAHYARLDSSRLVGTILEEPRAVYVSYRVGQRTAWTSRKIVLPAGERLLTDGTRAVRARCGNLVSDTAGEQGVAGASGERVDPAELDRRVEPPLVVARGSERGPESAAATPSLAPGDALPGAGGTPILLGAGSPGPEPGPFFNPVPGVLPLVLAGDEPKSDTPPGIPGSPTTTTTTGVVVPPTTTTTTGTVPPPTTTTTGVIVPPTTTTTTGVPPTTTTTTGVVPPATTSTTGVIVPPGTTSTSTTSASTITTLSPTTLVPTTGSVPEPTRLALLVLAWAVYRYKRRPD